MPVAENIIIYFMIMISKIMILMHLQRAVVWGLSCMGQGQSQSGPTIPQMQGLRGIKSDLVSTDSHTWSLHSLTTRLSGGCQHDGIFVSPDFSTQNT